METLVKGDQKGLYSGTSSEFHQEVAGVQFEVDEPKNPDMVLVNDGAFTPED